MPYLLISFSKILRFASSLKIAPSNAPKLPKASFENKILSIKKRFPTSFFDISSVIF